MEVSNKEFRRVLRFYEPIIEVGVIRLETPEFYIYYDYVNDVFTNFDDYNIVMSDYQIRYVREYFNRLIDNK